MVCTSGQLVLYAYKVQAAFDVCIIHRIGISWQLTSRVGVYKGLNFPWLDFSLEINSGN